MAQIAQAVGKYYRETVDALCDTSNFIRTVVDRIHTRHDREQRLCGTDITGRLFTANVLLSGLQGEPQSGFAAAVDRYTDQAPRHRTFKRIASGHVSRMRPTITEWYAKALRGADHNIGFEFSGWCEQREAE